MDSGRTSVPSDSLNVSQETLVHPGSRVNPRYAGVVPRPRDQVRRRREILRATSRLVAHKGLNGTTLRDVAEATGLTSGAVLYYYDSLDELFTAAYEHAIERFCDDRERATAGLEDPAQRIGAAVHLGVPPAAGDAEIRMLYELESVAFREPGCAALMAAYVERQVGMYAAMLEAGAATGDFSLTGDVRTIARNLVALEDGQGLYVLMGRDRPEAVEARILHYAAAATGVPVVRFRVPAG
jgi:AcrR family transcriptional regulator